MAVAREAVERLVRDYRVDAWKLKRNLLQVLVRKGAKIDRSQVRAMAEAFAQQAIRANAFEEAAAFLDIALAGARAQRDASAVRQIRQYRQRLGQMQQRWQQLQPVLTQLSTGAEDPQSRAAAGRYQALVKGDFSQAMPLLADSDDPQLKQLAQWESSAPITIDAIAQLADGWYELANQLEDIERYQAFRRAGYWYQRALALPDANGQLQQQMQARMQRVAKETETP